MDRGEFIKDGFTVWPAANGGWVVVRVDPERHAFVNAHASFSTFHDMIAWLQDQNEGLEGGKGRPELPPILTDKYPIPRNDQHSAYGCGYGCNDQVASTQCPIHGASDA